VHSPSKSARRPRKLPKALLPADVSAAIEDGIRPLFISATLGTDESILSLVSRVSAANLLERIGDVLTLAGLSKCQLSSVPFRDIAAAEALSRLLAIPERDLRARMHLPVIRDGIPDLVDWYGISLPRRFIEAKTRRFSPATLAQREWHCAADMLRPFNFCLHSWEYLQNHCPRCERQIGWKYARGIGTCEHCGRSLRQHRNQRLPWELRNDAAAVAALIDRDPAKRAAAVLVLPSPFSNWQPGDAFSAVVELGAVVAELDDESRRGIVLRTGLGDFSNFQPADLVNGYQFISEWPFSLEQRLSRIAATQTREHTTALCGLNKYFKSTNAATPLRDLTPFKPLRSGWRLASVRNAKSANSRIIQTKESALASAVHSPQIGYLDIRTGTLVISRSLR
jgi:hypothetical protein